MKPGASFYIFHADSEGYNFRGACHDIGLKVRQCLVWKKNSLVLGRQDYNAKIERLAKKEVKKAKKDVEKGIDKGVKEVEDALEGILK